MKSTGVVRNLDKLGRVVIPIELRRALGIGTEEPVEIYVENDLIVLQKYAAVCIFCGNENEVTEIEGKNVCKSCINKIKNL